MLNEWEVVFLSLGSNLGNRINNLKRARFLLEIEPKIEVVKVSSIYETFPIGPKQKDFLNCVFKIRTKRTPLNLLSVLKGIEKKMKRVRTYRDGPRIIDLDILFFGKRVVISKKLSIPHPRFAVRRFVLEPLAEIAGNLRPPGFKKSILQLRNPLTHPDQRVKLYSKFPL